MTATIAVPQIVAALLILAMLPHYLCAQGLDAALQQVPIAQLAAEAKQSGDAARGAVVFFQPYMSCSKCHSMGDGRPSPLGPDLTTLGQQVTDVELIESVLFPSKVIRKGFEAVSVATEDGKLLSGILVERTREKTVLRDLARNGELTTIKAADIAEVKEQKESLMPAGQMNQLA